MLRANPIPWWPLAVLLAVTGGAMVLTRGGPDQAAADLANKGEPAITVPEGFVVERVAGPPLVEHPMMAGFDERGRLFVAEAAGQNLKADELLKNPPNRIRMLEDTDGDGKFDKSTVFADKMTFPMGALWHQGGLYTASPPSLWRLEDTDGDGVADKRQETVTKFGFTGNAADIHGPFLGPDGRLYWCDGRHGHEIQRPDGSIMKGKAARIFRCRPDGSDVEVVCGGGMDNPVEIAFTPEGEPFATVNILVSKPQRIDAIIYAIEGGAFPYHDVVKEFKRTGDLLPAATHLGWVAPAGLMRYRGIALGKDYQDNLFSAQFNTHRIQRHRVERDGAGFRIRTEDFLTSTDPDFHPTDVLEDADGSLLVINTGGWFRIGCPTSQIAKPEIKGGIYRIRRKDAEKPSDPRGLKLKWDAMSSAELAKLLDDTRWPVRDRAIEQLAKEGAAAVPVLKQVLNPRASVEARRNAVWTLTRMDNPEARPLLRAALDDGESSVRLAATHAVGLNRDREALPRLQAMVAKDAPPLRRQAATALGRLKLAEAAPSLLEALRAAEDRFLEHALIYALIEINDREATLKGLRDPNPSVRRGALIALDQMDHGNLTRDLVTPLLNTPDPGLQQTALAIITTRPGWAAETVGLLREWLTQKDLDEMRKDNLRGALLAFCKDAAIQELVTSTLKEDKTPLPVRLLLLEMMTRAPLEKLPADWVTELGKSLEHQEERVVREAVAAIRAIGVKDYDDFLLRLAREKDRPVDLRVAAAGTVAARLENVGKDLFEFLVQQLDKEQPPLLRAAAAEALGNSRLSEAQLQGLTAVFNDAGPLEMPHLLAAYERSSNKEVGKELVAALAKAPALASLPPANLRRTLERYPAEVRAAAEPLLKKLEVNLGQQNARLAELEPFLKQGQAPRGHGVFFGKKAACAACHAVNSEGGRVGPDLSKIGGIRTSRDLLEAVVFPSASFVRGYEPWTILTRDGKLHTGVMARETTEAIYLHTAERAEVRIPRAAVDQIQQSRLSIMPQGLDAQLTREELADLIAYLQSLR